MSRRLSDDLAARLHNTDIKRPLTLTGWPNTNTLLIDAKTNMDDAIISQ